MAGIFKTLSGLLTAIDDTTQAVTAEVSHLTTKRAIARADELLVYRATSAQETVSALHTHAQWLSKASQQELDLLAQVLANRP